MKRPTGDKHMSIKCCLCDEGQSPPDYSFDVHGHSVCSGCHDICFSEYLERKKKAWKIFLRLLSNPDVNLESAASCAYSLLSDFENELDCQDYILEQIRYVEIETNGS